MKSFDLQVDILPAQPLEFIVQTIGDPPAVAKAGDSFSITDSTQNVGTAAAGASETRFYLSTDQSRGATDITMMGGRSVPTLSAGQFSSGSITVTVPITTPAGSYYLVGCADDLRTVPEANEDNNCGASTNRVDLTAVHRLYIPLAMRNY